MRLNFVIWTTVNLGAVGCNQGSILDAGRVEGSEQREASSGPVPEGLSVVTVAGADHVRAGDTVDVSCFLRGGAQFYRPESTTVTIAPQPASVVQHATGARFVATAAGTYTVACAATSYGADREGVRVEVEPGLAADWEAHATEQECYSASDRLAIDYTLYDIFGNETWDATVTARIEPEVGVTGNLDHGFRFHADGDYRVTVDVSDQDPASTIVPLEITVRVDATAPVIQLDTPAQGEMLVGHSDQIVVRGTAVDEQSAVVGLSIADQEVPVTPSSRSQSFDLVTTTRWGLSVVTGRAEDACGNVGYVARSLLRSREYLPVTTAVASEGLVPSAFTAQLNQSFADDGDRTDIDDLATLAERVLASYDFNTMLSPGALLAQRHPDECDGCPFGSVFFSVGADARRHPNSGRRIDLDPVQISNVDMVAGGLQFAASVHNFAFPLRVRVNVVECDFGCQVDHDIDVDAEVGVDRLDLSGIIGANLDTGEVAASLLNPQFVTHGAYLDIDCGVLDWACDEITDLLVDSAIEMLEDAVQEATVDMVPPLLEDVLESAESFSTLELPPPVATSLGVKVALDRLSFCGPDVGLPVPSACTDDAGSLALVLATQIFPTHRDATISAGARGPIELGGDTPNLDPESSFALAMKLDVVNQLLWSLWYSGAFDVPDLSELFGPDSSFSGSLQTGLPPVVMPGTGGQLHLGLGELQVDVVADVSSLLDLDAPTPVAVTMTVSAVVGAGAELEDGVLRLVPDTSPEIHFEIHQINDLGYSQLLGEAVGSLLARELPALLSDAVAEIPMPSFAVGDLGGVPEGTVWFLDRASLDHSDGVVVFQGIVGSRTP